MKFILFNCYKQDLLDHVSHVPLLIIFTVFCANTVTNYGDSIFILYIYIELLYLCSMFYFNKFFPQAKICYSPISNNISDQIFRISDVHSWSVKVVTGSLDFNLPVSPAITTELSVPTEWRRFATSEYHRRSQSDYNNLGSSYPHRSATKKILYVALMSD